MNTFIHHEGSQNTRDVKRGQMLEAEVEAEAKQLRPRSRSRPGPWGRGRGQLYEAEAKDYNEYVK